MTGLEFKSLISDYTTANNSCLSVGYQSSQAMSKFISDANAANYAELQSLMDSYQISYYIKAEVESKLINVYVNFYDVSEQSAKRMVMNDVESYARGLVVYSCSYVILQSFEGVID